MDGPAHHIVSSQVPLKHPPPLHTSPNPCDPTSSFFSSRHPRPSRRTPWPLLTLRVTLAEPMKWLRRWWVDDAAL